MKAHAVVKRINPDGCPPGLPLSCGDEREGKQLTASQLASRLLTETPWLSPSLPPRSRTSVPPPGSSPPWRRNAGVNANTCLWQR